LCASEGAVEVSRVDPSQVEQATSESRLRARRTTPGIIVIVGVVLLLMLLAWRMVPHPVGPARTYGKYEGKAATTAKSAESEVQTVLLAARTASAGNAFGPYTAVVISDAEESLSGVQGTFDSIQPPDERADKLAKELNTLLGDALEHVRDVRVAVRRGELTKLADVAKPLVDDAEKLNAFTEQHK
jgi:hypothetical protein